MTALDSSQKTQNLAAKLGSKERLGFDQLRLAVGERVKLDVAAGRGRFSVRYLGAYADRCLMVSMPQVNGVPKPLKEGARVTLRLIALDRACGFSTRVLKVLNAPVPMLLLTYPDEVEAVRVRKAPRVKTQLIVSVDEVDPGQFGSGWPRQALCGDISLHGACIEAGDQLGEIGDRLYVTARVKVGEVDQVMLLEAQIRNLEEIDDGFSNGFRMLHGVEFIAPDEETQLILTGFVYQQLLQEQVGL